MEEKKDTKEFPSAQFWVSGMADAFIRGQYYSIKEEAKTFMLDSENDKQTAWKINQFVISAIGHIALLCDMDCICLSSGLEKPDGTKGLFNQMNMFRHIRDSLGIENVSEWLRKQAEKSKK